MMNILDLQKENDRLTATIAAIHDHLHHERIDAAHEACECALSGKAVAPPNIVLEDAAKIHRFISEFNTIMQAHQVMACTVIFVPSKTKRGAVSIQIGGQVDACRIVENEFGKRSTYMGEHNGR